MGAKMGHKWFHSDTNERTRHKWQTSGIDQMRNKWDYCDALSHSMKRCDKYTNTVDHVKLLQGVKTGQSVKNTPHVRA